MALIQVHKFQRWRCKLLHRWWMLNRMNKRTVWLKVELNKDGLVIAKTCKDVHKSNLSKESNWILHKLRIFSVNFTIFHHLNRSESKRIKKKFYGKRYTEKKADEPTCGRVSQTKIRQHTIDHRNSDDLSVASSSATHPRKCTIMVQRSIDKKGINRRFEYSNISTILPLKASLVIHDC